MSIFPVAVMLGLLNFP